AVRGLHPPPSRGAADLVKNARAVLTDSGGLQEETTALGVPCLTLRENTERPITISEGTNRLVEWPMTADNVVRGALDALARADRSEEHTSELQSRDNLV